jgi:hypothetical protein
MHKFLYLSALVIIAFSAVSFAKESMTSRHNQAIVKGPTITMGLNDKGENTYFALQADGKFKEVDSSFVSNTISVLLKKSKSTFCNMEAKPESVTISIEVLSATWNIKDLCKT